MLDLAVVLFETATLRSGYLLPDTKAYGDRIERMLRLSLNIDLDAKVRVPGWPAICAGPGTAAAKPGMQLLLGSWLRWALF